MIALSVSFVYSFVFKGLLAYLAIVHNGVSFVHQCLVFSHTFQRYKSFPHSTQRCSRECLLNSAFRKSAIKSFGMKNKTTVKEAQNIMCEKLRLETGARLFEPEPAKKGNSNTGKNLRQVTRYPKTTAKILDCSE